MVQDRLGDVELHVAEFVGLGAERDPRLQRLEGFRDPLSLRNTLTLLPRPLSSASLVRFGSAAVTLFMRTNCPRLTKHYRGWWLWSEPKTSELGCVALGKRSVHCENPCNTEGCRKWLLHCDPVETAAVLEDAEACELAAGGPGGFVVELGCFTAACCLGTIVAGEGVVRCRRIPKQHRRRVGGGCHHQGDCLFAASRRHHRRQRCCDQLLLAVTGTKVVIGRTAGAPVGTAGGIFGLAFLEMAPPVPRPAACRVLLSLA